MIFQLRQSFEYFIVGVSILLFWLVLTTLPPLRIGIWGDSELLTLTAHFIAGVLGLSLVFFYKVNSITFTSGQLFLTAALGAIVGLSFIIYPFSSQPDLHFYGLPQTGEGVAFYLSFSIFLISFCCLVNRGWERILVINAMIASLFIFIITFVTHPGKVAFNPDWCPYVFSAFLAPIGIMVMLYSVVFEDKKIQLSCLGLGTIIILLSSNKTAIFALVIYALFLLVTKKLAISRKLLAAVVISIPFVIVLVEIILNKLGEFPSVDSRIKLLQVVWEEFKDHPWRIFTGFGWGHYTDALISQLRKLPVLFYQNGHFTPSWDSIERIDFHSHHQVVESILALGIGGGLIALILPALPIFLCKRENLLLTALVCSMWATISSMWFTLMVHLPFLALGLAIMSDSPDSELYQGFILFKKKLKAVAHWGFVIFLGSSSLLLIVASYHEWQIAKIYSSHNGCWFAQKIKYQPGEELVMMQPSHLKGIHMASHLRSTLDYAKAMPNDLDVLEDLLIFLGKIQKIPNPNLYLRLSCIEAFSYLAERNLLDSFLHQEWIKNLNFIQKNYPKRSDLLASFITYCLSKKNFSEAQNWIANILRNDSADCIGLWLKGLVLLNKGHLTEALPYLNQALEEGAEKWIPIAATLKTKILKRCKVHKP
jgi:hypothetical protein